MADPAFRTVGVEGYLRSERDNPTRHEYIDGLMYAQTRASRAHNVIVGNIHVALHPVAGRAGCFVYQSDMKVRVTPTRYHYPDLVVSCHEDPGDEYTETAPCLIVKVPGASTRSEDQVCGAERYRELPMLRGYLTVDSQSRAAALCRRTAEGWGMEVVEEAVRLPCPEVELRLDTICEGVRL